MFTLTYGLTVAARVEVSLEIGGASLKHLFESDRGRDVLRSTCHCAYIFPGSLVPALLSPEETTLAPPTSSSTRAPWSRRHGQPGGLVPALLLSEETTLALTGRPGAAAKADRGAWFPRCYSLRRPL